MPLFQDDIIETIEWSFDALYHVKDIPPWFDDLIQDFSQSNRLIGHGVYFSMFSARWSDDQKGWLKALSANVQRYKFQHVTEHFGFMSGANFHDGAPLPVPFTKKTCDIGQDRLMRMQEACQCPVGVENLALALHKDDVKKQGEFLNELIEPVNGFIILDLHNLYCQLHNFDMNVDNLLGSYPLHRVKEIHISGGSWESSVENPSKRIRRDTHDHAVPQVVFDLLSKAVKLCPSLTHVILEQLGRSLTTEASRLQFQQDFKTMRAIVKKHQPQYHEVLNLFIPEVKRPLTEYPLEDTILYLQQQELSDILENAQDVQSARQRCRASEKLRDSEWEIETWRDEMLETAIKVAQKWKSGFKASNPINR